LLAALPERAVAGQPLLAIEGMVPGQFDRPAGCLFSPRCAFANTRCREQVPLAASAELGAALCHTPLVNGQPVGLLSEALA
jgi:dipeptide transport system ATP-binding protein